MKNKITINDFENKMTSFIEILESEKDGVLKSMNNEAQKEFLDLLLLLMTNIKNISLKMNDNKVVLLKEKINIKNKDIVIISSFKEFIDFILSLNNDFFTNLSKDEINQINFDLQILNEGIKRILLSGVK